jgi:site-specific DNA recombinase
MRADEVTLPAALYIRVSSTLQARDDRYGLERQETEARACAARLGLPVGETYSDTINGRTETRKGLEALKASGTAYSAVITREADRLGRTPLAGARIVAELMAAGLEVHSAMDGKYDPDDDTSALTFDFRMLIAASELRSIKRRMLGGKLARAEKGGVIPHGWRCYGYRTHWQAAEGKPVRSIEVDDLEAVVVREVFARLAGGATTMQVADDLNRRGVPTALGKQWNAGRVWYMAKNRAYLGEVTMHLKHVDRDFTFELTPLVDLQVSACPRVGRGWRPGV